MTVFSKIISGEIPCHKIFEDKDFFAFLDISPLTYGHVLLITKEERDYFFDMDDVLIGKMTQIAKKIAIAMKKSIECKRIGMVVIGMEIPHAHIHLIPINNESDLHFSKPKLSLSTLELSTAASLIRKNI